MAAILEMPQYVVYLKNIAYGFIKVMICAKTNSFNILHNRCAQLYITFLVNVFFQKRQALAVVLYSNLVYDEGTY